jgi:hypothetical protein
MEVHYAMIYLCHVHKPNMLAHTLCYRAQMNMSDLWRTLIHTATLHVEFPQAISPRVAPPGDARGDNAAPPLAPPVRPSLPLPPPASAAAVAAPSTPKVVEGCSVLARW